MEVSIVLLILGMWSYVYYTNKTIERLNARIVTIESALTELRYRGKTFLEYGNDSK
jgi:hypothetical protein